MHKSRRTISLPQTDTLLQEEEFHKSAKVQLTCKDLSSSSYTSSSNSFESPKPVPFDQFKTKTIQYLRSQLSRRPRHSLDYDSSNQDCLSPLGEESEEYEETHNLDLQFAMQNILMNETKEKQKLEIRKRDCKNKLLQMIRNESPEIKTEKYQDSLRASVDSNETVSAAGSSFQNSDQSLVHFSRNI